MKEWLVLEEGTTPEQAEALDQALLTLVEWPSPADRLCGSRQALDGRMLLYVPPDDWTVRRDATDAEIDALVAMFDTHVTPETRQDQRTILGVARGNRRSLKGLLTAEIRRAVYREDALIRNGLLPEPTAP